MKSLAKILMMMALVFGAASCSENNELLPTPITEFENNHSRENSSSQDKTGNTSIDGFYKNIKVIDERSYKEGTLLSGGPIYFTEESFSGLEVVFRLRDDKGIYEIYAPSEELNLNLECLYYNFWFRVKEFTINGKEIEFKETILSYLNDDYKDLYFFEVSNDFFKINFNEEQKINLNISKNSSNEEITYEIKIDDTLPESKTDIIVFQAAK